MRHRVPVSRRCLLFRQVGDEDDGSQQWSGTSAGESDEGSLGESKRFPDSAYTSREEGRAVTTVASHSVDRERAAGGSPTVADSDGRLLEALCDPGVGTLFPPPPPL